MLALSGAIRHKTRKQPFRSALVAIFGVQLAAAIGGAAAAAGLI